MNKGNVLSFGGCYICGGKLADVWDADGIAHHSKCVECPKCGSDFVFWAYKKRPYIFRCQNCLNRWER